MKRRTSIWNNLYRAVKSGRRKQFRKQTPEFQRSLRLENLEERRLLAIVVNKATDEFDGNINDGDISLRDAVFAATAGETITFNSSVPNIGTLSLTLGQIDIGTTLTIDASMLSNGLTVNAATDSRIFDITDPISGNDSPLVTMKNLTLTGGDVSGDGGAIQSTARLALEDCTIDGNQATVRGGGIYVEVAGTGNVGSRTILELQNCTISDNTADGFSDGRGGGIFVKFASAESGTDTVIINNSTMSGNESRFNGGGLYIEGQTGSITKK